MTPGTGRGRDVFFAVRAALCDDVGAEVALPVGGVHCGDVATPPMTAVCRAQGAEDDVPGISFVRRLVVLSAPVAFARRTTVFVFNVTLSVFLIVPVERAIHFPVRVFVRDENASALSCADVSLFAFAGWSGLRLCQAGVRQVAVAVAE